LRTVRNRIPIELAAHLGAQLPLLVRGTYYDQFRPSEEPQTWRSAEQFLAIIADQLRSTRPVGARDAAQAVFRVLNQRIDAGQITKIRHALPEQVRELWPEPSEALRPVGAPA
jgi:uncharacterized protein (DUF2267 family)